MIAQELFHGFELDKFSKSVVQMSKKEFNHRMKQNKIFYKLSNAYTCCVIRYTLELEKTHPFFKKRVSK